MAEYSLRLPFPPSVNDLHGHKAVRRKADGKLTVIKYLLQKVRDYRYTVTEMVYEQLGAPPKLRGRLAVTIRAHARDPRADMDNIQKALLDALEYAQVFVNDNQIDQLLTIRKRRAATARVDVLIKTI